MNHGHNVVCVPNVSTKRIDNDNIYCRRQQLVALVHVKCEAITDITWKNTYKIMDIISLI